MPSTRSDHDETRDWRTFTDRDAYQARLVADLVAALSDEPGL